MSWEKFAKHYLSLSDIDFALDISRIDFGEDFLRIDGTGDAKCI